MGYTPHVLVLGGGVTGTAIARDLSIRGLDVTLVEQGTLTNGATGRMQGLLYSGARYADADPTVATQCIEENRTLREIAGHCIEETDGLLVTTGSDDEAFAAMVDGCEEVGIPVEELSGEQARAVEPALSRAVERAVRVPDRAVDPFALTVATARSAMEHGAEIRTHTEVTDIVVAEGAVKGVTVEYDPEPTGRGVEETDDGDSAVVERGDDEPGHTSDRESDDDNGDGSDDDSDDESADASEAESDDQSTEKPAGIKEEGAWGTPEDRETESDDSSQPDADSDSSAAGDDPIPDGGKDYPGSDINPIKPGGASKSRGAPGMPGTTEDRQEQPTASVDVLEPDYVVNATGAWAAQVAGLAGFEFPMHRSRGAMAVTRDRPVERPVTEGATPGTARTAVPHGDHCVLGATSEPADGPDDFDGSAAEIDGLLDDLAATVPSVEQAQILRSFWGVRSGPPRADSEGRRFAFVDHADRDDCWGMTTVVGGTLTTHRLVAERVGDHVCRKFGITRECRTDELPLPGSDEAADGHAGEEPNPVICETQSVTRAAIRHVLDDESTTDTDLTDVRIRTSAAMGACQGGRCGHRIAAELFHDYDEATVEDALTDLLAERWAGQRHALWGEGLARAARNYEFHAATLSRKYHADGDIAIEGFDDGPPRDSAGPGAARRGMHR